MSQSNNNGDRPVTPAFLREQSALALRLVHSLSNEEDRRLLRRIAEELEAEAVELERGAE
jgi:hypothetical protein